MFLLMPDKYLHFTIGIQAKIDKDDLDFSGSEDSRNSVSFPVIKKNKNKKQTNKNAHSKSKRVK